MKICCRCARYLPLSEFHYRAESSDGLAYHCRACQTRADAARWPARRALRLEQMSKYNQVYYEQHREEIILLVLQRRGSRFKPKVS